jgi:nitrilase
MSRGGSCIVDPMGRILAGPDFDGPTILVAELDLEEIPRAKFDFDVVGHYARPDVFRLVVNEAPTPPVVRNDTHQLGNEDSSPRPARDGGNS